ncbi:hypothetical protein MBLNU230_g2383t1 [Neophaeotheca triangularis]
MAFQQQQLRSYGYCDSYFVENHNDDEGVFARAAADRERVRNANKMRQKIIGEDLSRATADEYQADVLEHMENMEEQTMPDIASIEIQTEIQWFMRPYLLDFLLEAHHAFQLLPETLHLAVNLLDRYCSRRVVYKRHYQLVGCAALLIAAKYGDKKERVPTIRELKSMCCSLYDDDMFTQMEWHVLQTINWIIGHPTVSGFLDIAMTETCFDPVLKHMTEYLLELGLYYKDFIPVRPSVMARSALALARCIINRQQPPSCNWSARYDPQVVLNLSNFLQHPSAALSRKYSSVHLSSVSHSLERFLHQQAVLASQRQPPQMQDVHIHQPPQDTYLCPSTPQKGYPSAPVDVLTPPITPDKDLANQQTMYGHQHNMLPQQMEGYMPTPPSAVDEQQHQQPRFHYGTQYIPPPHFQ